MKIKNKILNIIVLTFFIILFNKTISNGAISASSKTVNSGENVSISISSNIPVCAYKVSMTNSGGLTFVNSSGGTGAGSTEITDAKTTGMSSLATYTFKAPNVSTDTTYTVSFTASAMEDENLTEIPSSSTTAKITVKAPVVPQTKDPAVVDSTPAPKPSTTSNKPSSTTETKKSSDNKLKELTVAEGTISPEFSKDVREYTLTVPNEITVLNITATPNNSKAKAEIKNNSELQVGENQVIITVIAEDGTTSNYIINVTREKPLLVLNTLKITYIDENGNTQELLLNPQFDPNVLEYNLDQISYLIKALNIEAIANLEGATIEIVGNENLLEGENTITITLTIKAEEAIEGKEQAEDETITYTIKFSKEATPIPPTLMGRISNWFNGMKNSIKTWYNDNYYNIVIISLYSSLLLLGGVIIYMSIDYDKYKMIIQKAQKVSQINQAELSSEIEIPKSIVTEKINTKIDNKEENIETKKAGRHF